MHGRCALSAGGGIDLRFDKSCGAADVSGSRRVATSQRDEGNSTSECVDCFCLCEWGKVGRLLASHCGFSCQIARQTCALLATVCSVCARKISPNQELEVNDPALGALELLVGSFYRGLNVGLFRAYWEAG
jgi:hypothetical protein